MYHQLLVMNFDKYSLFEFLIKWKFKKEVFHITYQTRFCPPYLYANIVCYYS